MELGRDGDFGMRDYDRWDSSTRKEKKREAERGQGIDSFLKQICTKIYCLFSESKIHYIFVFDSYPPLDLFFPTMRRKGKEKRKKKKKNKPRRTHSPHLILHQCGIYIKPNPPPLPGGSSLYIQQQHHISITLNIIIERDRLVKIFLIRSANRLHT